MTKAKNLIVFMSDEHNPKALGCYGNDFVKTPNLDAIAASHGLVATTATIANRRLLVEAMVRGYVRGVTALKTDREAAVEFIARRFKLELPLAVRCYDVFKDLWSAELSPDLIRSEIAFHARTLGRSPIELESIVDSQFAAIR